MLKKKTYRRKRAHAKRTLRPRRQHKLRLLRRQKGGYSWDAYAQFLRQYYSIIYLKKLPKGPTPAEIKARQFHNLITLPNSLEGEYEKEQQSYDRANASGANRNLEARFQSGANPIKKYNDIKEYKKSCLSLQIKNVFLNLIFPILMKIKPKDKDITHDQRSELFTNDKKEKEEIIDVQHFHEHDFEYIIEIKAEKIKEILEEIFHIPKIDITAFFDKFKDLFTNLADKIIDYFYKFKYYNKQELNNLGLDISFRKPGPNKKYFSPGIEYIKFTLTKNNREFFEEIVQNFIMDHEGKKKDEEETYGFEDA